MEKLLGKEIKEILFNEKDQIICFHVKDELNFDKFFYYSFFGDCCSECWVSDIIGVDNSNNTTVKSCSYLALGHTEQRTKQDIDDVHGIVIEFDNKPKNHNDNSKNLLILYRNSSNGSYYGSVDQIDKLDDNMGFALLKDDYYFKN